MLCYISLNFIIEITIACNRLDRLLGMLSNAQQCSAIISNAQHLPKWIKRRRGPAVTTLFVQDDM